MRKLEENKAEQKKLREKKENIEQKLKELEQEEAEIRFSADFPIGRRIFYKDKQYEVKGYVYNYIPEIEVRVIKKNGELSERIQYLGSYQLNDIRRKRKTNI